MSLTRKEKDMADGSIILDTSIDTSGIKKRHK